MLMTAAHHKCGRRNRLADAPVFNQLQCRLDSCSKKCLRSTSNEQSFDATISSTALPSSRVTPRGFSTYTCLPASSASSIICACSAGIVRLMTSSISGSASALGSVHSEYDTWRVPRHGTIDIRTRRQLQDIELMTVFHIDAADFSATNDTNLYFLHDPSLLLPYWLSPMPV